MKTVNIILGPRHWVREIDHDDPWDVGDSDCDVDIEAIESDTHNYDGISTDLDLPFYAVYAKYFTGSTFGSEAAGVVLGAYATEYEAAEAESGFAKDSSHNVPWNGYFESLEWIKIKYVTELKRNAYGWY